LPSAATMSPRERQHVFALHGEDPDQLAISVPPASHVLPNPGELPVIHVRLPWPSDAPGLRSRRVGQPGSSMARMGEEHARPPPVGALTSGNVVGQAHLEFEDTVRVSVLRANGRQGPRGVDPDPYRWLVPVRVHVGPYADGFVLGARRNLDWSDDRGVSGRLPKEHVFDSRGSSSAKSLLTDGRDR
jgi:hypothetical protein